MGKVECATPFFGRTCRALSFTVLVGSGVAPTAPAQTCPNRQATAQPGRMTGTLLDLGEGYRTLEGSHSRGLLGSVYGVLTAGFTHSDAGHSGPLAGVALGYSGIMPLGGPLRICLAGGVRYDYGTESATDLHGGFEATYPLGRHVLTGGATAVSQWYSLRKDPYATGREWFGTVDLGLAMRISSRSQLTPGLRLYPGYGWGRRPSLTLRWTRR